MAFWLFKEEPTHYSYSQLEKDRSTEWSGVRNPVAQKHLREVAKGDEIFYYHTGSEKAIVGVGKALDAPTRDLQDPSGKAVTVKVGPVRRLKNPVTLAQIKADARFSDLPLVRIPRLSVMPIPADLWKAILAMAE